MAVTAHLRLKTSLVKTVLRTSEIERLNMDDTIQIPKHLHILLRWQKLLRKRLFVRADVTYKLTKVKGFIAQSLEHRTGNAKIVGSIPVEARFFFTLTLQSLKIVFKL